MFFEFLFFAFVFVALLIPETQGQCRMLEFTEPMDGYRLTNHTIRTIDVSNEGVCKLQCYLEPNCVSYNFKKEEDSSGQHKCDLNNATYKHPDDLKKNRFFVYCGAENACAKKPCQNNATCQAGYTDKDYQCVCIPGFTGEHCQNALSVVICENNEGTISCQNGVIEVLYANYGRLDGQTCPHTAMSNTNCRSSNSLQVVRDKCNGQVTCELDANKDTFDGDPCSGTYKYLIVKYRCLEL